MGPIIEVNPLPSGHLSLTIRDSEGLPYPVRQNNIVKSNNLLGWSLTTVVEGTYEIVNHHFSDHYSVSTDNGSVSIDGDLIHYTPAIEGPAGFLLNGVKVGVTALWPGPLKPAILSPAQDEEDVPATFVLVSSTYIAEEPGLMHFKTQWQVATDANFTNIVYDHTSEVDLLSHAVSGLPDGTTYYVRVRYIGWRSV